MQGVPSSIMKWILLYSINGRNKIKNIKHYYCCYYLCYIRKYLIDAVIAVTQSTISSESGQWQPLQYPHLFSAILGKVALRKR